MSDTPAQNLSYADSYQPPTVGEAPTTQSMPANPSAAPTPPPVSDTPSTSPSASPSEAMTESLEDQNIFELLGVTKASDQDKEAFLDELQQVIWEDFLENDVELLLTPEEVAQLRQLMGDSSLDELAQQEAIVVFLEKIIPDLEEIMLEKALGLKSDMVKERLAGMREYFVAQPEKMTQISEAENLIQEDKWRSAAQTLNALS